MGRLFWEEISSRRVGGLEEVPQGWQGRQLMGAITLVSTELIVWLPVPAGLLWRTGFNGISNYPSERRRMRTFIDSFPSSWIQALTHGTVIPQSRQDAHEEHPEGSCNYSTVWVSERPRGREGEPLLGAAGRGCQITQLAASSCCCGTILAKDGPGGCEVQPKGTSQARQRACSLVMG